MLSIRSFLCMCILGQKSTMEDCKMVMSEWSRHLHIQTLLLISEILYPECRTYDFLLSDICAEKQEKSAFFDFLFCKKSSTRPRRAQEETSMLERAASARRKTEEGMNVHLSDKQ